MSKVQNYCFTWNNYDEATEGFLAELFESQNIEYMCYGREVAPTTGTKHLQGFIRFGSKRSPNAIRKLLKGAHVEVSKGNVWQNHDYCSKGGDYVEFGEKKSRVSELTSRELHQRYWVAPNWTTLLGSDRSFITNMAELSPNSRILLID